MKSAIFMDGEKFEETEFKLEEDFEKIVKENSKRLFGQKTIYFDVKNKIETKTLGGVIPDGFLFDFKDKENPEFYLVEVELEKHDFDRHIFPQIKKFFSFFKNSLSRDDLIGKIFNFIKSNKLLEQEFKKFIGESEIYKTLKDVIENSQNILLVIDEYKPEFEETSETITEWAKLVKVEVLKKYTANKKSIFTLNPDFEDIGFAEPVSSTKENVEYNEGYHLGDVNETVLNIYNKIKEKVNQLDPEIKLNPQKYYISLRKKRNFAYLDFKKKKIKMAVMLPLEAGKKYVTQYKLREFTEGIKRFYGHDSFEVTITHEAHLDQILQLIEEAYREQEKE